MIFKCKNCGGGVVYDPSRKSMYCPHCDGTDSEDIIKGGSTAQCLNCGAPITTGQYTSSDRCVHCGCSIVFDERIEGDYKPDLILPFKVSKDMAVEALNKEFDRRIFTPASFLSEKSLNSMRGIYVPFWLYDYKADYDFSGEGIKVRTWVSGNIEYTETSYFNVIRQMEADFDKVPADASIEMNDGEMDLMEPYLYNELEDFEPKYMSGFFGEVYNQGADELEQRARAKAKEASEELMQQSFAGYNSVRPYRKNLNLEKNGLNYALMPVWLYQYDYRGETYRFDVNGQTGKVVGNTPVSKLKVLLYGLTTMVSISVIFYLAIAILEVL